VLFLQLTSHPPGRSLNVDPKLRYLWRSSYSTTLMTVGAGPAGDGPLKGGDPEP